MKRLTFLLVAGTVLLASSPLLLHAQRGCVDSPEDPTAVLVLLGTAATFGEYARRHFWSTKANKKDNR